MANLPDGSGDAYSNLVQGDGSASLTFVMPGTVPLAVGSVVATVDNSAGAATTATLVIRDSSGEVIATKRQSATIDAGASGTATWALRLDDDTTATTPPTPPGTQLAYVERTTALNLDGTLRVFVTAPSVTLDGATRIQVTWYALNLQSPNVAFTASNVFLFDGTTALGLLAQTTTQGDAVGNYTVVTASRFLTPSAGSHTYAIKAQTTNAAGGGVILAGAGGGGFVMPSFLRVTTA